jgi:3D (Asp-Asp-Asp) domain-containing protein
MTTTPISSVQEPQQAPETLSVTLTSYNAVAAQTSPTPWITASGATSNSQVIAARSRDLANELPYGTIIAIDGADSSGTYCGYNTVQHLIGYRVIADSMAERMHDKVDVMLNQYDTVPLGGREINPSVALGACTGVTVKVVGYVDPSNIPSTQAALADLVEGSDHLASKSF